MANEEIKAPFACRNVRIGRGTRGPRRGEQQKSGCGDCGSEVRNDHVSRSGNAVAAFLFLMLTPNWAAARDFPWADGRFALPVFVTGALTLLLVGWAVDRAGARRRKASLGRRAFGTAGVVLWLAMVTLVGTYALFAEQDVAKSPWQLAGYLLGFAIFLPVANRALGKVSPPSESAEDIDT